MPYLIARVSFSIWACRFCAGVRALDAYAKGFSSCRRTAPNPLELASTVRVSGLLGS